MEIKTKSEKKLYEWAYRSTINLAISMLKSDNLQAKIDGTEDEWPAQQDWDGMVGSSHAIYLRKAREMAGIDHDEWLNLVRHNHEAQEIANPIYEALAGDI